MSDNTIKTIQRTIRRSTMSEVDRIREDLERIAHLKQRGVATWADEQRSHALRRRLADIEFEARDVGGAA